MRLLGWTGPSVGGLMVRVRQLPHYLHFNSLYWYWSSWEWLEASVQVQVLSAKRQQRQQKQCKHTAAIIFILTLSRRWSS